MREYEREYEREREREDREELQKTEKERIVAWLLEKLQS